MIKLRITQPKFTEGEIVIAEYGRGTSRYATQVTIMRSFYQRHWKYEVKDLSNATYSSIVLSDTQFKDTVSTMWKDEQDLMKIE